MALIALVAAVPGALAALGRAGSGERLRQVGNRGAVYVQTNTEPQNFVQVYFRRADGWLTRGPRVRTGGSGSATSPPLGFPFVDTQGAVALDDTADLLFAVNAGSNTVSSFIVTPTGLVRADQVSARGVFPASVAVTRRGPGRNLLYVLNELSKTVSGYTVDSGGKMTPIPNGVEQVSGGFSAQVGFDTSGRVLTVANRSNNTISTFTVRPNGRLGEEIVTPGQGGFPFGFDYTRRSHLIVATSTIPLTPIYPGLGASYLVDPRTAGVRAIGAVPSRALDTCWVEMSKDDRYAFMTNGASGNISRFRVSRRGQLTFLGLTPTPAPAALDLDKSRDGRFLYVLNTDVTLSPNGQPLFGASRVTTYAIRSNGGLSRLASTPQLPFAGASGLAAW